MANFFKLGFIGVTDPSIIRSFYAYVQDAGRYSSLQRTGADLTAGTNYSVPAGKKLILVKAFGPNANQAGSTYFAHLGYADTGVGQNTTSAPTNQKYLLGDASGSNALFFPMLGTHLTANSVSRSEWDFYVEVPAGKFPFIKGYSSAQYAFHFLGIEVDA